MKKITKIGVALSQFALWGTVAQAAVFQITNRTYGSVTDPAVQAQIDTLLNQIESDVNADLPQGDVSQYPTAVANSTSLAAAGLGSDYSVPFNWFTVGVSSGIGADMGSNSISDLIRNRIKGNQLSGFGAQVAFVVGLNLGLFSHGPWFGGLVEPSRLRVYADILPSRSFTSNGVGVSASSFGLHAKYKLLTEKYWALHSLKWDGVDIGTGFQHASFSASYSKTYNVQETKQITYQGVNDNVNATAYAPVAIGAGVSTLTIPLEISSGFRVAYILDFYGGLSTDIAFGSATANASITNATFSATDQSGLMGTIGGTPAASIGTSGSASHLTLREFVGLGIDLVAANLYVQLNKSSADSNMYGLTLGARAYW